MAYPLTEVRLTLPLGSVYPLYFSAKNRYSNSMNKETDLTPILDLFHQLPEGTGKVVLLLALFVGVGVLLTLNTKGSLTGADYFIWWD